MGWVIKFLRDVRVGIGTTQPQSDSKLDVNGKIRGQGLQIDGDVTITGQINASGPIYAGNSVFALGIVKAPKLVATLPPSKCGAVPTGGGGGFAFGAPEEYWSRDIVVPRWDLKTKKADTLLWSAILSFQLFMADPTGFEPVTFRSVV